MDGQGIPLESFKLEEREYERCKNWSQLLKRYSVCESESEVDLENLECEFANDEKDDEREEISGAEYYEDVEMEDTHAESPFDQSVLRLRMFSSTLIQAQPRHRNAKNIGFDIMGPLIEEREEGEEEEEEGEKLSVDDDDSIDLQNILNQTIPKLAAIKRKWKDSGMLRILNTFDDEKIERTVGSWLRQNKNITNEVLQSRKGDDDDDDDDEDDSLHSMETARYILSNRKPRSNSGCFNTIKTYRMLQKKRDALHEKYAFPEEELNRVLAQTRHRHRIHSPKNHLPGINGFLSATKPSPRSYTAATAGKKRKFQNRQFLRKCPPQRCYLTSSSSSGSSDEDVAATNAYVKYPIRWQRSKAKLSNCRQSKYGDSTESVETASLNSTISDRLAMKPRKRLSECSCSKKKRLCKATQHLADTSTEEWLVENTESPKKETKMSVTRKTTTIKTLKGENIKSALGSQRKTIKKINNSKPEQQQQQKVVNKRKKSALIEEKIAANDDDDDDDDVESLLESTFERDLKLAVQLSKKVYEEELNKKKIKNERERTMKTQHKVGPPTLKQSFVTEEIANSDRNKNEFQMKKPIEKKASIIKGQTFKMDSGAESQAEHIRKLKKSQKHEEGHEGSPKADTNNIKRERKKNMEQTVVKTVEVKSKKLKKIISKDLLPPTEIDENYNSSKNGKLEQNLDKPRLKVATPLEQSKARKEEVHLKSTTKKVNSVHSERVIPPSEQTILLFENMKPKQQKSAKIAAANEAKLTLKNNLEIAENCCPPPKPFIDRNKSERKTKLKVPKSIEKIKQNLEMISEAGMQTKENRNMKKSQQRIEVTNDEMNNFKKEENMEPIMLLTTTTTTTIAEKSKNVKKTISKENFLQSTKIDENSIPYIKKNNIEGNGDLITPTIITPIEQTSTKLKMKSKSSRKVHLMQPKNEDSNKLSNSFEKIAEQSSRIQRMPLEKMKPSQQITSQQQQQQQQQTSDVAKISPNGSLNKTKLNSFSPSLIDDISPTRFGLKPQPKSLKVKKVKKMLERSKNGNVTFPKCVAKNLITNTTKLSSSSSSSAIRKNTITDGRIKNKNNISADDDDSSDCLLVSSTTNDDLHQEQVPKPFNKSILLYAPNKRHLVPMHCVADGVFELSVEHLSSVIGQTMAMKFMKYYKGRRRFDANLTVYYRPPQHSIGSTVDDESDDSDVDELQEIDRYGDLYVVFDR